MKLLVDIALLAGRFGLFLAAGIILLFSVDFLWHAAGGGAAERVQQARERIQRAEGHRNDEIRLLGEQAALDAELQGQRNTAETVQRERDLLATVTLPLTDLALENQRIRIDLLKATMTAEAMHRSGATDPRRTTECGLPAFAQGLWNDPRAASAQLVTCLTDHITDQVTRDVSARVRAQVLGAAAAEVDTAELLAEAYRTQTKLTERRDADAARVADAALILDELAQDLQALRAQHAETAAELSRVREQLGAAETARVRDQMVVAVWDFTAELTADVRAHWQRRWRQLLLLLLAIWATPYAWRTLQYWVLAPLLARAAPIRLREPADDGTIHAHQAHRVAPVDVAPGQTLLVRASHVRQVERDVSTTRLFYSKRFAFLSYVADLFLLTEIANDRPGGEPIRVTLADASDASADTYILRIDLDDHPGLVISPRHLIAVTDGLELQSDWRPGHLHAWARGQVRFISLKGTGSLWLQGFGDVHPETLTGRESHQAGPAYLCFDGRLQTRSLRRETFVPYLLGRVPLLEVSMKGHGLYAWQKSIHATGTNPVTRAWNAFWSALGRLVGF
ncbi:MAG: hypothetical protein EA398_16440 [Deltaproteobacteria bacterium]|nr:MAG: hypothetical protein EA398_16440 [Deltaproteobacteria bacterium]